MLRIALISVNGTPLSKPLVADFGEAGGCIGRDERNKLALPDPERRLSRVQALVRFERNFFCLIDQGTTPTIVNGIPLSKGSSLRLRDGDVIDAAGFRMRVSLSSALSDSHKTDCDPVVQPRLPVDMPGPWGIQAPALGVLSEPVVHAQPQIDEALLPDPFDELLVEPLPAPIETFAKTPLELKYGALLEAFRPENLERRLLSEAHDEASNDEHGARLWSLYQQHFSQIEAEVVRSLCRLQLADEGEMPSVAEGDSNSRAVAGGRVL